MTAISTPARAWIGLGANLGEAAATVMAALEALGRIPSTRRLRTSSLYRSAPQDAQGPDYVNAVAELATDLAPEELLRELHRIEVAHGRARPYRHAPRTLDLDLLMYGDVCLAQPDLVLPHPRLHERAFVLVPLAEVEPELRVPGRGWVADLLPFVVGQTIVRIAASQVCGPADIQHR